MKIITVNDLLGTERAVEFDCGMISTRILVESDGMGYTVTRTEIPKGDWRHWHYPKHLETCYCIEGRGLLRDLETGTTHTIFPGSVYVLDKHDDHKFLAITDVVLICVFNPPLKGSEVHDENGEYN